MNQKPKYYVWSYWENRPNKNIPPYINLCLKIIKSNCHRFNVVILNEKTLTKYLPNIRKDINILPLALKSDYIRMALLYEYGGVWIDADTIVMSINKIELLLNENWDFIGFGCTGNVCNYGYPYPSNQLMASQPKGILVKNCLQKLNYLMDYGIKEDSVFSYFDFGKNILWSEIEKLRKNGYKYYHFRSHVDGSRDVNKKWVTPNLIFKDEIEYVSSDLMVVFLANSYYCGSNKKYNWFCNKNENDILSNDTMISKMFKKALNNK